MARKRTIYSLLLTMLTLYVVCRCLVSPGIIGFTPTAYRYRMVNVMAPTDQRRQTTTSSDSSSACQLERLLFMRHEEFSKFTISRPLKDLPPSRLTSTERSSLIDLLDMVQGFLDQNNVSYVLGYHSLLGSYVMHDILPYDDTIQLLASVSLNKTVSKAIAKDDKLITTGYSSVHPSYTHVRFFVKTPGKQPPHWPFVELHFYDENSTHVWTTMPLPKRVVMEIDSFYPFHERPFAAHWIRAPKDPLKFLLQIYSKSDYEYFGWNHSSNVAEKPTKITWRGMRVKYPFVGRVNCGEGVKETLTCHGVDQYNIYIDEQFPTETMTLGLG